MVVPRRRSGHVLSATLAITAVAGLACDRDEPAEASGVVVLPKKKEPPPGTPSDGPQAQRPDAPTTAAPLADEPSAKMTDTGVLSEEAFKALHQHKEGAAPKPRGEMLELEGTAAYLSLPASAKAPMPAVVVIHEWWGLNDHIKHWADRLADDGYAALAVDLYGGKTATEADQAMALMKSVDAAAAQKTLAAAHRFLSEDPRVSAQKRGVIGWCFGGGWSLRHALATSDLDAAVIYYGRLVDDPKQLAAISAPVLGVFGSEDQGIPPQSVDTFESAMKEAGKSLKVLRFEANHAFANPSSARYQPEAAAAAWTDVRSFLATHLR